MHPQPDHRGEVSWRELLAAFLRIGINSFGGPAGQIGVMHKVLVDEKRWIDDARFTHALNFCMLLPGPEATQLATYVGWLLRGTRGGIVAGLLFVLPGALCMLALSLLAFGSHGSPLLAWLLIGLKGAAVALVFHAVFRMSKRTLRTPGAWALAIGALLASLVQVPFPVVLLAAAFIGILALWRAAPVAQGDAPIIHASPPSHRSTLIVLFTWLAIWIAPLAALIALCTPGHPLSEIAILYSKAALMSFGGAYAAIAYVSGEIVREHAWADVSTISTGLALAETTPGPLVLVFQFFGYAAGFGRVAGVPPTLGGVLGAVVALWATFAPCFLWIFVGAPYMEALRASRRLTTIMHAISAAVVGVIANFGVLLIVTAMFRARQSFRLPWGSVQVPEFSSAILPPIIVALVAFYALTRWKWGVGRVVLLSLVLGALGQVYMFLAHSGENWAD